MNTHVLPDSRLLDRGRQTVMADWPLPGGATARIEVSPVYCANCGKFHGHVPKDNTSFAFYLCAGCFGRWGAIAGTYAQPDDEFARDVAHEMEARFGRALTDVEVAALADQGKLGEWLELLEKESPYPCP